MSRKLKAFISIDFDYFIRERPEWDFGHREINIFLEMMWRVRYETGNVDLLAETDPKKYADFMPPMWFSKFISKGLKLGAGIKAFSNENHAGIMQAVQYCKPFDVLINFDAHHDFYGAKENEDLHCGNWGWHFMLERPDVKHIWVRPKWHREVFASSYKDQLYGTPYKNFRATEFEQLDMSNFEAVGFFFCRSGCWVPPHHDKLFNEMVGMINPSLALPPRGIKPDEQKRLEYRKALQKKFSTLPENY